MWRALRAMCVEEVPTERETDLTAEGNMVEVSAHTVGEIKKG